MTPAAKPPGTAAAAQPMPAPKLYHVTLSCGPIGVIGHCLSDVISTVTELYPDQHILSALVAPEWDE